MFNIKNIIIYSLIFGISLGAATQLVQGECSENQFWHSSGKCIDKVFQPTKEFQEILDGQQIPKGLHVKLDFATGLKFAKLNEISLDDKDGRGVILSTNQENATIPITPPGPVAIHNPAKGQHQAPDNKVPAEENRIMQELLGYLDTLKDLKQFNDSEFIGKLNEIEDLVYRGQFGYDLTLNHNFPQLVKLMEETKNINLKKQISKTIGIAVQNNPFAQLEASKHNLIDRTFKLLKSEKDPSSQSKLIFLLSSLVRNHETTVKLFHKLNGPQVLLDIYQTTKNPEVRKKCVTLLTDSFNPNMMEHEGHSTFVDQQSLEDKLWSKQSSGNVIDSWCQTIHTNLLEDKLSFDEKEKLITGVLELRELFPDYCQSNHHLIKWLDSEHSKYDKDEDFSDYVELVEKLKSQE